MLLVLLFWALIASFSGAIIIPNAVCNNDNCLNAFKNKGNEAVQFCKAFNTTVPPTPLPKFVSKCSGAQASRINSACSCLTSISVAQPKPTCNRDNCLRAFIGEGSEAISFCSTFTKAAAQTPFPKFASQCTGDQTSRMTSACSCIATLSSSSTLKATSSSISTSRSTSSSSSSSLSTKSSISVPTPSCYPTFVLEGASEQAFNKKASPFSVKVTCSTLDVKNFTVFSNFNPVINMAATSTGITFDGFTDDYVLLYIYALDTSGTPFLGSFQLLFGAINMPVLILDSAGNPTKGTSVQANSTIYPGVSQSCITAADGRCLFTNLIASTISLVARTEDNSIAVNGLAATTGLITMKLMPYVVPGPNDSFDISNGTTGWDGGFNSDTAFKVKRDTSLVVSTNGQAGLQSAHKSFPVHPFTKVVYVRYKFVTAEVPGGFFGTQFNDYFSISIRSDTGAFVSITNSMNALGLGAFDASGATDWFTLQLSVPSNTKSVRYDIGVSNVADNLYDSKIIVQKAGDLQCDNCGDCSTCPSDPMCQATCISPPNKTCDFYRNCAQKQLGCSADEYPLAYGDKNCNKFVSNIDHFSPQGQAWVYDTMHCLQMAMVPVLKPCTATCSSFGAAAFASHAKCYVDSGVCGLGCLDVIWIVATVNTDLVSLQSFWQIIQTAGGCMLNLIQTLEGCGGDALIVGSPLSIAVKVTLLILKHSL